LTARINADLRGMDWFFSGTVVYVLTEGIRLVGGMALLLYLEWRLALAAVALLPLMVVAVRFFSRRLYALSHWRMEQQATILKRLQETMGAMELVKAFAAEEREGERLVEAYGTARQLTMEGSAVGAAASAVLQAIPDVARGIVLIVGAWLAIRGAWTLGSLLAFQAYLGYVYGPARFLADANLSLQGSLAAMERVMTLFQTVPEENLERGATVERLRGEVAFREVGFAYGGGDGVLEEVSFDVRPGEHVAIVGPSGVGKTTLLSLLLCFYAPTEGEILFDGAPMSAYNLSSLRQRIGYVSQRTLLLAGSFEENLRYGNPGATRAEVERACRVAGLHGYIASLPQGYGTRIDERGANLSEGQKQRLAMARALIKNPDILILDEPTSALDSVVERWILDELPAYVGGKTMFVVAHRLTTIQRCDRILLLDQKRLVATGTHASLLAESELYREMVEKQWIGG
jgi:ATP-binding cassette, subfamily B, bacterial MsbA